jgi:thiosulfate/3-mercaptopyruvate sulfurtransferase
MTMNAKTTSSPGNLVGLILFAVIGLATVAAAGSWSERDLKDPAELAATLSDSKAPQPVILNVGPVQQIKGAIAIGPASAPENLDKLKQQLAKIPKDKEVIIYCGCCPFRRCPNAQPAFDLLKQMKFTKARLLNLPTSLETDWISKGYPME